MQKFDTDFLAHDGEVAGLIAALDWSATWLGSFGRWPQILRTTIALIWGTGTSNILSSSSVRTAA